MTGGLHCGASRRAAAGLAVRSSRPSRAGSIAAPRPITSSASCTWRSSRPCRAGSIAARTPRHHQPTHIVRRRPAPAGRAPLRLVTRTRASMKFESSSRSSGAGSIAASWPGGVLRRAAIVVPLLRSGLHCGWEINGPRDWDKHASSRSSGAGSIAAAPPSQAPRSAGSRPAPPERAPLRLRCVRGRGACGEAGRPAPPERAPLRRPAAWRSRSRCRPVVPLLRSGLHCGTNGPNAGAAACIVVPLLRSGLHCGAPAGQRARGGRRVVPLLRSGLHCGGGWLTRNKAAAVSSRSSGAGSIAAPCDDTVRCIDLLGRPAPPERAPLRQDQRRIRDRLERRVVPLLRSGLHCGCDSSPQRLCRGHRSSRSSGAGSIAASTPCTGCISARTVVPLLRSGLHCGSDPVADAAGLGPVVPLLRSGLHCGKVKRGRNQCHDLRSSRSSGAGSIAALVGAARGAPGGAGRPAPPERAPLRHAIERAGGIATCKSSRSSGAGSIAAAIPTGISFRGRRVVPLLRSGLHCGGLGQLADLVGEVVVPLLRSGLHCGSGRKRSRTCCHESSRSSGAGSIAAGRCASGR